ncbi:SDR family NAD(P)-dependent oxidoreductase [Chloroflexota bacterium]
MKKLNEKKEAINSESKLAVVTGAGHRLGEEIARTVADLGYTLILHYFTSEKKAFNLSNKLTNAGAVVHMFRADLTKKDEIAGLWKFIDGLEGELKLLVNSASIMSTTKIGKLTPEEFDHVISINLKAPFLCSQEASKRMNSGSLIVNISDIASNLNWTGFPLHSVSKAALDSLTKIFAKDLAPDIRVNGIAPGLVIPPEFMDSSDWDKLVDKVPLKRNAVVEEITQTIRFLIENEYITGQTIIIDGGRSL